MIGSGASGTVTPCDRSRQGIKLVTVRRGLRFPLSGASRRTCHIAARRRTEARSGRTAVECEVVSRWPW